MSMTSPSNASICPSSAQLGLSILLRGLGWLSGLGLLGAGMAFAEDQAPSTVVPNATELLQIEAPAAAPIAPPAPAPAAPPAPAPVVEVPAPAPEPASVIESEPTPVEEAPAIAAPPSVPTPEALSNRNDIPISPSDVFIDPTEYSVGATTRTDGPSTIVLSERSTGCQRVIQSGQSVPSSICQEAPSSRMSATPVARQPRSSQPWVARRSSPSSSGEGSRGYSALERVVGQTTAAGREFYNRGAIALNRLRRGEYQFVFPLTIPAPITSAFGWRIHPISGDQRFHAGTDIGAPLGTPVIAAQAGRVAVSDFLRGYGFTVVLNHEDDRKQVVEQSLYAHMSKLLVEPGDWIEQGEVIGLVGSTGNSTGPHLHFELKQLTADGWVLVDPGQLLEYALAQLVETLKLAQSNPQPQTAQPNQG